ncbi:MAG: helix-turn-helix domain-containing protein [Chloroflexi bacterium]|nr:helix-turn-helix domain-containing protein [Chloroflexota bacterium]
MAEVIVEDMWKLGLPEGTNLVAGRSGLSRAVSWPVTLRTRPPAFESVKGGEIALLATSAIKTLDERLTLTRIIRSLGDTGAAAVAVLGEVDTDAREAAESLGLPLFSLPGNARLQELEQTLTRAVVDRRTELHQRGLEIQRQLTDLVIEGRGLAAIVEAIAQISGKPAALGDGKAGIRFYHAPPGAPNGPAREEAIAALETSIGGLPRLFPTAALSSSDPPKAKIALEVGGLASVVAPVVVKGSIRGYTWVLGRENELDELDGLAAKRAASACALELVKEIAVSEAEDRLHGDFLDDLLSSDLPPAEAMRARAERFGWDLDQPCVALVVEACVADGRRSSGSVKPALAREGRLIEAVERRLARRHASALIGARASRVIVIYAYPSLAEVVALKRDVEGLRQEIASSLGEAGLSVGLGRHRSGLSGPRESYHEAEQALAMGVRLFGPGRVTYFGELGIYRLLFRMHGTQELEDFYSSALGKLKEYERKNGAEFIKTLEAYFTCRNSPTEAAELLHIHRNTLLYRLQRIEEIAGIRLDDPETRLSLHLALRIRETLQAVAG